MSGRFAVGYQVKVRWADPPGHLRTPFYARGKRGVVERCLGDFLNPEELAYGRSGLPKQPLYRIRFLQRELWPDYLGRPEDSVDIEIYEHWLQPA